MKGEEEGRKNKEQIENPLTFSCDSLEQRTVPASQFPTTTRWKAGQRRPEKPMRTSTLSQRQFPQGAPSTTSHRTFRARQETHARAARRLVILAGWSDSADGDALFFMLPLFLSVTTVFADVDAGEGGAADPSDASATMVVRIGRVFVRGESEGMVLSKKPTVESRALL